MIHKSLIQKRITVDGRGKIKSGKKSEKGLPLKLDYFEISKFNELKEAYGEKPNKLIIFFPSDKIEDFFDFDFVKWGVGTGSGKGVRVRQCDGVKCIHFTNENVKGKTYGAGEETPCICNGLDDSVKEEKNKMCKADIYIKAFIYLPTEKQVDNPVCYLFESHSFNTGMNLLSVIETTRELNNGILRGIPFVLSVKMITKASDPKQSYPIWHLQPMGMLSDIRKNTLAMQEKGLLLPEQGTVEIEIETADPETPLDEETIKALPQPAAAQAQPETKKGNEINPLTQGETLFPVTELEILKQEVDSYANGNSKAELLEYKVTIQERISKLSADDQKSFYLFFNNILKNKP